MQNFISQKIATVRGQKCPNPACAKNAQKKERVSIWIHGQKRRRLKCSQCGKTWSGRGIFKGLRSNEEKIRHVQELLKNGRSVRNTAKAADVSPGTVQRWKYLCAIKNPYHFIP